MKRLSRREALLWICGAGATVAGVAAFWRPFRSRPTLPPPPIDDGRPAPLRGETLTTLMAIAEAIIGLPIERDHYRDFLRWRAEHLPGYRVLCDRFAAHVDAAAKRTAGRSFAECELRQRIEIARAAIAAGASASLLAGFETVRRELLLLFARTDAWILAGYDSWPGVPRGLEDYRRAPARGAGP